MKRQVALKIIKPGMDSAQVIRRFEAERQALALLDHPNVEPRRGTGRCVGWVLNPRVTLFSLLAPHASAIIVPREAPLTKLRRMRWSPIWAGQMW